MVDFCSLYDLIVSMEVLSSYTLLVFIHAMSCRRFQNRPRFFFYFVKCTHFYLIEFYHGICLVSKIMERFDYPGGIRTQNLRNV